MNASAAGDGAICLVGPTSAYIYDNGSGSASTSVMASASGAGSIAIVPSAMAYVNIGGSGTADTNVSANAENGAGAEASGYAQLCGVDGDISVYSVADASGQEGYATSEVNVTNGAPTGFYIDAAKDDYGFAIAFVVAYGDNNVLAVGYSQTDGGNAMAVVMASPAGVIVDAVVGLTADQ